MRVLYFHQHFSTPKGSAGIRSYEMARRLVSQGHEVTMVCGSYGGGNTGLAGDFSRGRREGKVDGIEVIEFDLAYSNADGFIKRSLLFLLFALRSVGVALTHQYDVLFATTTPLTAGIPGIFSRWLRGKPFVFEVRDLWPELPREMGVITNPVVLWAMGVLEWVSYRSAHRVVGLSPGIVQGIERCGVPSDRIALVPNGCDFSIFEQEVETWRPEGVEKGDLLAIFTGTHGMANGLDSVLDAANLLQERGRNDIKIALVGDGKFKPQLQARAREQGLDNVVFHDPVNKQRLAGLMKAADLGIQSLANVPAFYFGTSPNKFFDYISAGLPVLNNYPGWLAGMIKENGCGFAVEPDSPEQFADALEAAASNRGALQLMGKAATQLAHREFDRDSLGVKFVDFLAEAASLPIATPMKRAMDILGAAAGLFILTPVILVLGLLVRRKHGAPICFRQERPGKGGKSFEMIKFRTMTDERGEGGELLPDAERLTSFGQFLRSTSLDELPELWNVLKGDMSLVGPRPLLMEYLPLYSERQARRHDLKPGITGWAQINGRNALSWEEKFELDVWYVENRTLWLDIKILFLTVWQVVKRDGISHGEEATMPRFEGAGERRASQELSREDS
ncbi:sugar transferase [Alcanivorax sp.]|uniref:sugar transferase n=1 Tax=Alcanivorax sp. TaxID=1872427 RepID=UPI0025C1B9B0|nr:sugar transferase [Alcanivorax sp.]